MKNLRTTLVVGMLLCGTALYAQPSFDTDVDDVEQAPIPGLAIAAAVGIAIGVKKVMNDE
jgi:hypothetical protein